MNIYVGNLSFDATSDNLREVFEETGTVTSANVITDKFTGRSKGFGFVEMPDETQATEAISKLNGSSYMGRNMKVNQAKPRPERSEKRRSW